MINPSNEPAKPKKIITIIPSGQLTESIPDTQPESDKSDSTSSSENSSIFQAIGVIAGTVDLKAKPHPTISIQERDYVLHHAPQKKLIFDFLKKQIRNSGSDYVRLMVYPRVIHFPLRDKPHVIGFQVLGFDNGSKSGLFADYQDLEFRFTGLWQFIPACQTPCISVFRNFTAERLDYIKQTETSRKVRFMKASHIPLLWKDAIVPPFRFNPLLPKEERGKPSFVEIKAKFLPHRNVFAFESLLGLPQDKPPKFLKASKDDKLAAFKEKKANIAASKGNKPKPQPQSKPVKKAQPKTQTQPVQPPTTPHQTRSQ
ncbi:hypothetical protein [Nostoc sp. TCL26-01]|uniref:hypothetical protein n=1 Tax=Nostoc sp. TCL26-01 TaxID=2576904 RepID=UPI0015B9CC6C|nr:hypothetical protein [Nostoc sp. TCL26-01]QLE59985.1 hypothetical protein FD725_31740 [Nostoc sp. TCL26-01]